MEDKIIALRSELEYEEAESQIIIGQDQARETKKVKDTQKLILSRHAEERGETFVVDEQIIAAPTLIEALPLPLRRIIGDLSNTEQVLVGLELKKKI